MLPEAVMITPPQSLTTVSCFPSEDYDGTSLYDMLSVRRHTYAGACFFFLSFPSLQIPPLPYPLWLCSGPYSHWYDNFSS